jgi:diguanylate cyclase (GGDEF)-like protein
VTTQSAASSEASLAHGYRRLAALCRDVVAEQSVEAVLGRVLSTLRELVRCEDVVVWESVGGELAVALVDGDDEEAMRALRIRVGEGLTGKAALQGEVIVSNDAHLDPRAGLVPGTTQTPEAVMCAPLIARDRFIGVLSVYRRGQNRAFAAPEIELIADFAALSALALDNARVRGQLELLATTDELTGLPNRRRFFAELEREAATARRYRSPLSLLLIDLDNFKQINDTFGHTIGDQALDTVGKTIERRLRAPDLVARLGGDEFAVLLPQTDRVAATALARELEERIGRALAPPLRTSASTGISTLDHDQRGELLEEADRLLYWAKRAHPAADSLRAVPQTILEQRSSHDPQTNTVDPTQAPQTVSHASAPRDPEAADLSEQRLAERYRMFSEAGLPPRQALNLATTTPPDVQPHSSPQFDARTRRR